MTRTAAITADVLARAGRRARWPRATTSPLALGMIVLVVALAVTGAVAAQLRGSAQAAVDTELERVAADIEVQVNRRVDVTQSALATMAAQVGSGVATSHDVQRVLAGTGVVEQVPGLLAMLFAEASVTENGPRVAPRAIHPLAPNVKVLGRNLLADPERRRAIEAARDSGRLSATSVVQHVDGDVEAILVLLPVYDGRPPDSIIERRERFLGVMIGVVSPDQLFADVERLPLAARVEDLGPTTTVSRTGSPMTEVWHSEDPFTPRSMTRDLRLADRTWRLTLSPGDGFFAMSSTATVALVAGVLLSLVLALLASVLAGRREHLEAVVEERTRELQRANDELERVSRLRSQFITTVSHELRTPLTAVLGFVQTVRRLGGGDQPVLDDFLERAERNAQTLRRMIEDLLDFGRLERGDLVLERQVLDLGTHLSWLVRDLEPTLGGRDAELELTGDLLAEVDSSALERIISNLIANALRYAPGAGPLELAVCERDGMVELRCADRGPGFHERDIPMLTERFVRGSGVMGEGTGIGLAVVRELAEAHGGSIELRNRVGGGAEVVVRLPGLAPERRQAVLAQVRDEVATPA